MLPRRSIALVCQVVVQVSVGIIYKVASSGGERGQGFAFSTTSAIAIAEFIKFCISGALYLIRPAAGSSAETSDKEAAATGLTAHAVLHILMLALLYAVNNQLSLFVYTMADSGTVFLFKSGSTLIVAFVQYLLLGRHLVKGQWLALIVQMCGMVCVQYNPCSGLPVYGPLVYGLLSVSTMLTSISTVRNEYLVKNWTIPLHLTNTVLYAWGFALNLCAFFLVPNLKDPDVRKGFFEGYDSWPAMGVVLANAMIGLAMSAVYRYADAVAKLFAQDCTTIILMVFSTVTMRFPSTLITWVGVVTVLAAMHLYQDQAPSSAAGSDAKKKL